MEVGLSGRGGADLYLDAGSWAVRAVSVLNAS
jgi:hypothetical protein